MKKTLLLLGVGVGGLVVAPRVIARLQALREPGHEPQEAEDKGASEREGLLRRAIAEGEREIETGWLAVKKGSRQEVVEFGRKMANLHDAANRKLLDMAGRLGLSLPESGPGTDSALQQLRACEDGSFDRHFIEKQLSTHEELKSIFTGLAADKLYPELAGFARESLQMIGRHLREARHLQEALP